MASKHVHSLIFLSIVSLLIVQSTQRILIKIHRQRGGVIEEYQIPNPRNITITQSSNGYEFSPKLTVIPATTTKKTPTTETTTQNSLQIPADYQKHKTGHYKYHKNANIWGKAKKICEQEGAYLTVIDSDLEATILENILQQNANISHVFVGFHDLFIEGDFVTVQNEPIAQVEYRQWAHKIHQEPNGGTAENCGGFSAANGGLMDVKCETPMQFICEFNTTPTGNVPFCEDLLTGINNVQAV